MVRASVTLEKREREREREKQKVESVLTCRWGQKAASPQAEGTTKRNWLSLFPFSPPSLSLRRERSWLTVALTSLNSEDDGSRVLLEILCGSQGKVWSRVSWVRVQVSTPPSSSVKKKEKNTLLNGFGFSFSSRSDGKFQYINNSNYKNDSSIRKECFVTQAVLDELKRIVETSEVSPWGISAG